MRHYLNDKLKAQVDMNGNSCYPIYFMFSFNRQTFKIKSRILNRPYSHKDFKAFEKSNNVYLEKDREIIQYCIENSVSNGFIDINEFKSLYTKNCTSLYLWLHQHARSPGQKHMDDFMFGRERESEEQTKLRAIEEYMNLDGYIVLSYFKSFHDYFRQDQDLSKYLLIYDWEHGLHETFRHFIQKSGRLPVEHENLIPFINRLITII